MSLLNAKVMKFQWAVGNFHQRLNSICTLLIKVTVEAEEPVK